MGVIAATRELLTGNPVAPGIAMMRRPAERRDLSIADPALAEWFGLAPDDAAGELVTPRTAMALTAVFRCVSLIAGTAATLPMKSYRELQDGTRERVSTFLDDPGGADGQTPYEWKETLFAHLLLHGDAFALHLYSDGGGIVGLQLLDPGACQLRLVNGVKVVTVTLADGTRREFGPDDLTHIPALTLDGLHGLTPIGMARRSIGTGLAGDRAAARHFSSGLLMGGLVSGDDTLTDDQAEEVLTSFKRNVLGARKAGGLAVVNAGLKFQPWTMNATDAQFLESRAFQVEEIARMYGVPKVLLAQDGASSWGSGIAELIRGLQRFTLVPWTTRVAERLSRLLSSPRMVEFDYAGLLAGSPREQVESMKLELDAGLLTRDEGRRILNRPALDTPAPEPEA
jgi:HK97 family phage portal protein